MELEGELLGILRRSIAPSAWASRAAVSSWPSHPAPSATAWSCTGPVRVSISAATEAKKQPPG